jgi:hypothetical protein
MTVLSNDVCNFDENIVDTFRWSSIFVSIFIDELVGD